MPSSQASKMQTTSVLGGRLLPGVSCRHTCSGGITVDFGAAVQGHSGCPVPQGPSQPLLPCPGCSALVTPAAALTPRHHVQPAPSSPRCFSFSTDSLGSDITVFLIYWFPGLPLPWKRNCPRAAGPDPSVHSCLSGPRGGWHTGRAQECLLRAHVTHVITGVTVPQREGSGCRQLPGKGAHWERSPSGPAWDPRAGKAGLACASLPGLLAAPEHQPRNPLVESFPLGSGLRGTV